jgi:hypothetical protein
MLRGVVWFQTFRDSLSVPEGTEPVGCPETSIINQKSTSRNVPEEGRPYLDHVRSLESSMSL